MRSLIRVGRAVAMLFTISILALAVPLGAQAVPTPDAGTFTIEIDTADLARSTEIKVPNLVGSKADKGVKKLSALGLKWNFSKLVLIKSNWWITKQGTKPGTMVSKGATIKLTVSKTNPSPAPSASPTASEFSTASGLDVGFAWQACEDYGAANYPFGFDLHFLIGQIAQQIDPTTDSWYLKAQVTITNAYNAKYETVAECTVHGTNKAPELTSFFVYP